MNTIRITPNELIERLHALSRNELSKNPQAYAFFLLSLGGGLRAVEVPLIRWKDFRDSSLYIPANDTENCKTSRSRTPLSTKVVEELNSLRPDGANPNDFIVTGVDSTHPLQEKEHLPPCRVAFKELSRWLRQHGLPPQPIAFLRILFGLKMMTDANPDILEAAAEHLGYTCVVENDKSEQ